MSVSSSTALADHAANTLMVAAARSVGAHDAARGLLVSVPWKAQDLDGWMARVARLGKNHESQWLVSGLCWWFSILGKAFERWGEFLGNVPGIVEYHRRPTLINSQRSAEICTHIMQRGTGCSTFMIPSGE